LQVLDDLDALQGIVDRLVAARGSAPQGWDEAVSAGLLRRTPLDPTGLPYLIDPDGRVRPSPDSRLLPLPVEPKRLAPMAP
jgi:hypothetical protein